MEIDPRNNEELKTLDKSVDLGAIFDDKCKGISEKGGSGIDQEDRSTHSSEPKAKRRKKNRCPVDGCRKRLGLLDLTCKCEQKFCMKHRRPEEHNCNYDFKSEGRKKLAKDNKIVSGKKVEKI
jgi:hypothetical protein